MMYIFVVALFASAMSERVLVVTPQSVRDPSDGSDAATDDDSYVEAYREVHHTVRDRRNPLGSYEEKYNTLSHSSVIEDDIYSELNHGTTHHHKPHHHHHHRHPSTAVIYGPPTPVSHHHHHHQLPEYVSSHHTFIDIFPPLHFFAAFLHKFGLHKILKIMAKIIVLKVILKFITVIAVFLVLPAFASQEKEKEDSDEDGLLKSLGDVTNEVWNGMTMSKKMEGLGHQENHQGQYQMQQSNVQIHQKPPQPVMNRPDKDKDKDKCMDKDKEECKDKDKDKCMGKDKNMDKDKCGEKDKDKNKEKHMDESELDDVELKLLRKIIKQWKEENLGGPDKSSAISFLRHCVSTANRILGILLGYLKMKNGNMDVLDGMMLDRFSIFKKHLVKMWPRVMSAWEG